MPGSAGDHASSPCEILDVSDQFGCFSVHLVGTRRYFSLGPPLILFPLIFRSLIVLADIITGRVGLRRHLRVHVFTFVQFDF